jgi:hypothetical protein
MATELNRSRKWQTTLFGQNAKFIGVNIIIQGLTSRILFRSIYLKLCKILVKPRIVATVRRGYGVGETKGQLKQQKRKC